ncbi:PHO85 cyclin-1 [Psilocybe cubensis]|uniref:PHO85 cyclin-1 n=2 Tax=Psilocybe cubensis TaxID=181762 RepID=A0ACB8H9Z8_PSICU|nr:PHO85 cyclin-1 [Psilocybe cubensis]KAH9484482.1 PHO85 cyclin-1 [Psilocybe cubensis]
MASPASSSSSMSSSSSPVHHASLVDPARHNPALLQLVDFKVSRQVIEYTIDIVVETVDYALGRTTPSSSRGRPLRRPEHAKFSDFVSKVLTRAEVTMPTLLATLAYIDRARPHLHIGMEEWALERVFLGALIVASKYLNDSTLKNVHWAMCTSVFGKRDVGRIEREFLDVLNFELKITEDDLMSHYQGLADAVSLSSSRRPVESVKEASLPTYTHTERRHSRRRPAPVASAVPELSPPSPVSSSSSSSSSPSDSPRTPESMDIDPASPAKRSMEHPSKHHIQLPLPHQANPTTARKMMNAAQFSTMELLRSFPIPRMTTA